MNNIVLGDTTYTILYADLLPPLSDQDYSKLRDDIAQRGIIVAVVIDEYCNVIDGQHRLKIAAELGIANVPFEIRPGLDDNEKRSMAWDLNAHRRHMTSEQRREYAAKLRGDGFSLREIAEKTGTTKSTVSRDLTGVPNGTPVTTQVTGKDGKTYRYTPRKPTVVRVDDTGDVQQAAQTTREIGAAIEGTVTAAALAQEKRIASLLQAIPEQWAWRCKEVAGRDLGKIAVLVRLYKSAGSVQSNGTFFEIMRTGGFHWGDDLERWIDYNKASEETIGQALQSIAKHHAREARKSKMQERAEIAQSLPPTIFNVLYADPAWEYSNTGTHGAAEHHYQTMPTSDICAMLSGSNVQIADNAVLFMWVTNPLITDAFEVIKAWGFEYKTNIVWVKTDLVKPGSGFYVRGRHELLFICTRGSMTPLEDVSPPIGSVITAPVQDHSRKPDEVYTIIERLYPGCNYLEMFARSARDGWHAWGDEIE